MLKAFNLVMFMGPWAHENDQMNDSNISPTCLFTLFVQSGVQGYCNLHYFDMFSTLFVHFGETRIWHYFYMFFGSGYVFQKLQYCVFWDILAPGIINPLL